MKNNVIKNKSFEFSLRIIKLYQHLILNNEFVISKQVLKSGTSIGALIRESENAESTKDFIHKLSIAQKETNETMYWLELLGKSNLIKSSGLDSIYKDAEELMKIITAIIKTTKSKI